MKKITGEFLKIERWEDLGYKIQWEDASESLHWAILFDDFSSEDARLAELEILRLREELEKASTAKRAKKIKDDIAYNEMVASWPEIYKAHCRNEKLEAFFTKRGSSTEGSLQEEDRKLDDSKDRMLEVANKKVVNLRREITVLRNDKKYSNRPNRQTLFEIADKCRKGNGTINFSELRKKLGKSDKTAKQWCKDYGIE
jgi:hypothetical protein